MAHINIHLLSGTRGGTCRGYVLDTKGGTVSATFDLADGSTVTFYGTPAQALNLAVEFIQVAAGLAAELERRRAEEAAEKARGAKAETGAEADSEEDQVNIETFGK